MNRKVTYPCWASSIECLARENRARVVLLPILPFLRDAAATSIESFFGAMGEPPPRGLTWEEILDTICSGRVERLVDVNGNCFLDDRWRYKEIDKLVERGRNFREEIADQLRAELLLIEGSFGRVFGRYPPPGFWSSRQVCESLLHAARLHRSIEDGPDAWVAFEWAVRGASQFAAISTKIDESPTTRRQLVDDALRRWQVATGKEFKRRDIVRVARHSSPRQFQFWQAGSPKATLTDDDNFRRILGMSAESFLAALESANRPQ
jgi:hypothetical protein